MLIKDGQVLGLERVTGGAGDTAYSFTRVHVLDGLQVHGCRLADGWPVDQPLTVGQFIDANVSVRAYVGRGGPALGVTLDSPAPLRASASE